mmetsp:Transcript_74065/g.130925  ORF Transcript_74065/g.130925 Transcript_74065/m.130925 type:complete len:485 (+) Transcript_74065:115-1569(+)
MSWRAESTFKPSSAFVEDEKEYLKLARKIRDILKLEEKQTAGEKLAQNQLEKVGTKAALLKDVTKIAVKLPGETDVFDKTQDITDLLSSSLQADIAKKRKQEQEKKESRQKKQEEERNKPIFMCRHDRPILQVCVTADGRHLFTCSKDKYVLCWSMEQKLLKSIITFAGHTGAVFAVDVSSGPGPSWLLTGAADGQVLFWQGDPSRHTHFTVASPTHRLEHGGMVRTLRWCPFDNGQAASGGKGGYASAPEASGRRFASASEKLGSKPAAIAVWQVSPSGATKKLLEIKDLPTRANDLQWGGGAKLKLFSAHENGYVGVWSVEGEGSLMKTIKLHAEPVTALSLGNGGSTLVTASRDKTSIAVDVTQPTTPTLATYEWNRPLNAVAVSSDFKVGESGHVIVGGGKEARDVTRASDLREDEFEAKVFDAASKEPVAAGQGHFGPIHCLLSLPRTGPKGAVASVSEDGCLRVHGLDGNLLHSDTLS